jgi:rhamnogalacturonan endolyase
MYADGSRSKDGSTFGAWLVMNTVDTYFGGPTHSDLTVDGIVYNYICESAFPLRISLKLTSP